MARLSRWFGRLLDLLMVVACLLLLAMTVMIGIDVLFRNIGAGGLAVSNELSEDILYLITLLAAPWLLRQGQHIRVDIVLQALPRRLAWNLEWLGDLVGLACCVAMAWYGAQAAWSSYASGAVNIRTLVTPEWWALLPLPVVFVLLAVEMLFRMARLQRGERGPRHDAVSAA